MSGIQSNLSDSKYGYDMVVGTTQDSINVTMKNYLSSYDGEEFIMCYVYDANVAEGQSTTVATNFDDYKEKLGFDPFDIPQGTPSNDERIIALKDNFFLFAFKTKTGIPTPPLGSSPATLQNYANNLPDVIVLDKGSSSVTYNLYCKEFQIINLTVGGYGDTSWDNLNQNDYSSPWTFSFTVDLDLYQNDSAFNSLPSEVQDQVKNLSPSSMFSVQQLYLDLNTAGLESTPDIQNLDKTSEAYIFLTGIFLNTYFDNMQNQDISDTNPEGNYMLGYTIQPLDSPSDPAPTSSIVPTDLNFMVAPFLDEQGNATDNYNLYTLNWLVMTKSHSMPAPVPFEWNWVEIADASNFNGVMSINKTFFVNFLNQILSQNLKELCIIPKCSVNAYTVNFDIEFSQEPNNQSYQLVNNDNSKVLTFSYTRNSSDDDWAYLGVVQTSIYCSYTLTSNVYFIGSTIQIVTTTDTYLKTIIDGGETKGHICKYTSTVDYAIAVQDDRLIITSGNPNVVNQSDDIDSSTWATIITFGQADDIAADLQDTILDAVKGFAIGYNDNILDLLNSSKAFVFPGGTTFSFKDAQFSEGLDLISNVTYNDPK